jgi:hypothetical protein
MKEGYMEDAALRPRYLIKNHEGKSDLERDEKPLNENNLEEDRVRYYRCKKRKSVR